MKGDEVMGTVKISQRNSKMGNVPSVSLPAVITCRECDCHQKCYARKLERLRPADGMRTGIILKFYKTIQTLTGGRLRRRLC